MLNASLFASMADPHTIRYTLSKPQRISSVEQVCVFENENSLKVTEISSLGEYTDHGFLKIAQSMNLSGYYTLRLPNVPEATIVPLDIFDSVDFAQNYHYAGTDLGACTCDGHTTFKVWAPTASQVKLNLFTAGDSVPAYEIIDMAKTEKGVWEHTAPCGHGTYYTFAVTTALGTQEAVDPYAKSAGVNGKRGMVVDLSQTNPEGWETAHLSPPLSCYRKAIIWEIHVRDFSNKLSASNYKGKYLAFTETGLVNEAGCSVGIDYLKELGITHVHLLPIYDYATVDEANPDKGFNWGYDPLNYNVPEGSYATDPYRGEVRIHEFKQMVKALHEAGIGVVMDMVYNHTYDTHSSFNKIVPYYYYRYTPTGENTSASCCGNDTASERYMFRKFMVESTSYWVSEYKLDGLRFDLMGLHDIATMQQVESAVHTINPNAILYGEGWTMGATLDGSLQANQGNIHLIQPTGNAIGSIAVFNDVIRDGLKGSIFYDTSRGFISGEASSSTADVLFGICGGQGKQQNWSVPDAMVINYISAHDNHTLWDKLAISNSEDAPEKRCRMNRLGAAIIMISQGTPFWQAGEELLRTKGGDDNSFRSSDEVNNIDWSVLKSGSPEYTTMCYYQGLIQMRKTFPVFTSRATQVTNVQISEDLLSITFDDGHGAQALVLINPSNNILSYPLSGQWNLVADVDRAGKTILAHEHGTVAIAPVSIRIYVRQN